jgi:hypothetical protein
MPEWFRAVYWRVVKAHPVLLKDQQRVCWLSVGYFVSTRSSMQLLIAWLVEYSREIMAVRKCSYEVVIATATLLHPLSRGTLLRRLKIRMN